MKIIGTAATTAGASNASEGFRYGDDADEDRETSQEPRGPQSGCFLYLALRDP